MTRLDNFVNKLNETSPGLQIKFKNESWVMRLVGTLLFFNSKFMTDFVTTVGKTIYLPSRDWLLNTPENTALSVVSHEYMHTRDYQRLSVLFMFLYLFPLCMAPLFLILLFFVSWPWVLGLVLLSLTPLPAPGRAYFEYRGYTMSLFSFNCLAKEISMPEATRLENMNRMVDFYNSQFTGFNYYLMWMFGLKNKFSTTVDSILSEDLEKSNVIYSDVASALAATK